nr:MULTISPECIES: protein YgfX [unclassified Pseudomonas]
MLAAYLLAQLFALGALFLLSIPLWASSLGVLLCLAHGFWVLPRQILLTHPQAYCGLRRDADGWQLWNQAQGWQSVQLRPDSLALPLVVILRFRLRGKRRVRTICVPHDSQAADLHRRLRVRLRFSRRRWAAPE